MIARLDFSIGPVQGFVSQSRRTRDLWGSSYLLAFLSAHAMHGAAKAGAEIAQPVVKDDPLYRWVAGNPLRTDDPPRLGSLPNHFVAKVDGDAVQVAKAATDAFNSAWKRAHEAVWERFVAHACPMGNDTQAIWNRQAGAFWEIMWTAAPWDDPGQFARRKHWRGQVRPAEPGDKCTIMHDLQELSGHVRTHHRRDQDEFWARVRQRVGTLDIRDNERLCAIALVKRLLPKVAQAGLGWEVDASRWPSTVYVAAIPWIRRVATAIPQRAAEYAEHVRRCASDVLAMPRPPFDLSTPAAGDFPKLDANYLRREFVADERLCSLRDDVELAARENLAGLLKAIYDNERLGPPPSFYALLLADGDRLGQLLGQAGAETVSNALKDFTNDVPNVVREHDGVTVYAGGDDVLAMLPLAPALACAQALSDAYRKAFAGTKGAKAATLSAAVVFAHVRLPLGQVLGRAHRLLDDVAKEGNGRDSLGVEVLKPGGPYCQWVTTWTRHDAPGSPRAVDQLDGLVKQLEANQQKPSLSSALVYRIRDVLGRLGGWERWEPGHWGDVPKGIDLRTFLLAEIRHSLDVGTDGRANLAESMTDIVWNLLQPARNPPTEPGDQHVCAANSLRARKGAPARAAEKTDETVQAGVDALLLGRFLADPEQRAPNE